MLARGFTLRPSSFSSTIPSGVYICFLSSKKKIPSEIQAFPIPYIWLLTVPPQMQVRCYSMLILCFFLDTNSNVTNSSRLHISWSRKALKNYHSVLPQIHFKEQKCCGPQKSQLNRNNNVMQPDFTTSQSHGNSQVQG